MYNYIGPGKATPGIFCTAILSPYLRNGKPVIERVQWIARFNRLIPGMGSSLYGGNVKQARTMLS